MKFKLKVEYNDLKNFYIIFNDSIMIDVDDPVILNTLIKLYIYMLEKYNFRK